MTVALTLTPTGRTSLDLIGGSISLARETSVESFLPIPVFEEAYAESQDTEGGQRISSRPQNPSGSGKVTITGTSSSDFWTNVATWQQTVEQVRQDGGVFTYTPEGGTEVTYDIASIRITKMPQDNVLISNEISESEFEYTCLPFGRLAPITVVSALNSSLPIFGVDLGNRAYADVCAADSPVIAWRLGTNGATDTSGNARNGTGGGGITIGGVAAPGALTSLETDGATDFDGTDDRITSTWSPFSDSSVETFEGWAYRDASASNDNLYAGNGGATAPSLTLLSGGNDVRFRVRDNDAGATSSTTWTSAWPGNGQWAYWAIIVDLANDIAELWVNGISQGVKTGLTQTHSTPGNFQVGAVGSAFSDPFDGKMDEIRAYIGRLTPNRIFAHYQAGKVRVAIPGSVDALGDLILTDAATQNRNHVEVGLEKNFDASTPDAFILDSTELTSYGTATTRTGAYDPVGAGNTVVRGTMTATPAAVVATPTLGHVGRWRIRARVYQSGSGTGRVRLAWRIGSEGPLTRNAWVTLPIAGSWYEPDLGLIDIPDALTGTQSWQGWIEHYSSVNLDTIDLDYIEIIPAARYGKARGPLVAEVGGTYSARDEFDQTAGAATGKTLPVGGTWAGAGDADDFSVEATGHTIQRTAVSDSSFINGRLLTASSPSLSNVSVQADVKWSVNTGGEIGLLARYVDSSNYLGAWMDTTAGGTTGVVAIYKVIAGVSTTLWQGPRTTTWGQVSTYYTMRVTVDSDGNWAVWSVTTGSPLAAPLGVGFDSALATGGTLASGKVGVYDSNATATASTRNIDNFQAWVPLTNPHAINSLKRLEITDKIALREPASGTTWAPVPTYEGSYLKIPANSTSRLAIKARAYDIDQVASSAPAKLQADLTITPRVLLLG